LPQDPWVAKGLLKAKATLRTAVLKGNLDKDAASHDDLFDRFRLSLKFFPLSYSSFQRLFDYLYPLRSPLRGFERICKIESFMCDFAIPELHDGHPIDWTLIFISNN
jgi:hypothetical protein